jgi:hypothetical protein
MSGGWGKTEMLNPCQWALAGMTAAGSPKGVVFADQAREGLPVNKIENLS